MPIYRVPEYDNPPQDSRRRHHHHRRCQQQQQHDQPQSYFDHLQQLQRSDETSVQKSHSTPKPVAETRRRSSSPALLQQQLVPHQGDESIVEREIRLQLEKEAEIAKLHRSLEMNASDELDTRGGGGTHGVEEEAASPENGRRRQSSVTEYLIARELTEQKRREDELRGRHGNNPVAKVKDGDGERTGRRNSSSGKPPDSGHTVNARQSSSLQDQLSFEDPDEEELDLSRISVEDPPRRTRGSDPFPPPSMSGEQRRLRRRGDGPRRSSSGLEAEEDLLRRLAATDRLRQELLSERQREIDLRRQGKISTTSEERVGLDPSLLTGGKSARGAASSTVGDGLSHRVQADAPRLSGGGDVNRPSASWRSTGRHQSETARLSVEQRIEEEVREARRREKELREQRRLLNAALL